MLKYFAVSFLCPFKLHFIWPEYVSTVVSSFLENVFGQPYYVTFVSSFSSLHFTATLARVIQPVNSSFSLLFQYLRKKNLIEIVYIYSFFFFVYHPRLLFCI